MWSFTNVIGFLYVSIANVVGFLYVLIVNTCVFFVSVSQVITAGCYSFVIDRHWAEQLYECFWSECPWSGWLVF